MWVPNDQMGVNIYFMYLLAGYISPMAFLVIAFALYFSRFVPFSDRLTSTVGVATVSPSLLFIFELAYGVF